jgi:hypothetical protein
MLAINCIKFELFYLEMLNKLENNYINYREVVYECCFVNYIAVVSFRI